MTTLQQYKTAKIELQKMQDRTFLTEKENIERLENLLVNEVETILENELNDFVENFGFENSDFQQCNDHHGIDYIKEVDAIFNEYPCSIVDQAKENFTNNSCGYFDDQNNTYIQSTYEDAFFKDDNLIIDSKWHKVKNELHAQLLNELNACDSGMIASIYNLDYYDNVSKFTHVDLPICLKAFNTDDETTSRKLAQIIDVFELWQKQDSTWIESSDLDGIFNYKDIEYISDDFEIVIDDIELVDNFLYIHYSNVNDKKSIVLKVALKDL